MGLKPGDFGLKPGDFGLKPTDLGLKPADFGLKPGDLGLKPDGLLLKLVTPFPFPYPKHIHIVYIENTLTFKYYDQNYLITKILNTINKHKITRGFKRKGVVEEVWRKTQEQHK